MSPSARSTAPRARSFLSAVALLAGVCCATTALALPITSVSIAPDPIYAGDTVGVSGSGYTTSLNTWVNSISWTFDFGDDSAAVTGNPVSHVYTDPGAYVLSYTALFLESYTYYVWQYLYSYWVSTGPFGRGYYQAVYGNVPHTGSTTETATGSLLLTVLERSAPSTSVADGGSTVAILGLSLLGLVTLKRRALPAAAQR